MTEVLLSWFLAAGRKLPWRKNRTTYRIWVSEIMLQQTQVTTVIPYYQRWLKRFPTVKALAEASLDDVLKVWEGLGYYRRARHLHQAAQLIAFERKGRFPKTYQGWLELPGIGVYTAAAIASISHGERVLAIDGNVTRVGSRLFKLADANYPSIYNQLFPYVSKTQPGDFNEALMELGATICTPRSPKCPDCPVNTFCRAFQDNQVNDYPSPKRRKQVPHYHKYALILSENESLWLRQRPKGEMLSGLWGFVLSDEKPAKATMLEPVTHAYTHFKLTVIPVFVGTAKNMTGIYIAFKDIETLALSTLDKKILQVLKKHLAINVNS